MDTLGLCSGGSLRRLLTRLVRTTAAVTIFAEISHCPFEWNVQNQSAARLDHSHAGYAGPACRKVWDVSCRDSMVRAAYICDDLLC